MGDGKKSGIDFGLFLLRVALGGLLVFHGFAEVAGNSAPGVRGVADVLAQGPLSQFAHPLAVAGISAEIGGGALIVLGLFTRLGAVAALCGLLLLSGVAWPAGFRLMQDPKSLMQSIQAHEITFVACAMAVVLLCTGSGAYCIPIGKKG